MDKQSKSTYYLHVARQQLNNLASYYEANHEISDNFEGDIRDYLASVLPNGRLVLLRDSSDIDVRVLWGSCVNCEENNIGVNGCIREDILM